MLFCSCLYGGTRRTFAYFYEFWESRPLRNLIYGQFIFIESSLVKEVAVLPVRETIFQFSTLISGTQRHQKFFYSKHSIEVVISRDFGSSPSLFLLWKSGFIISLCLLGLTFYLKKFFERLSRVSLLHKEN